MWIRAYPVALALLIIVAGCGAPVQPTTSGVSSQSGAGSAPPSAPKRITAVIRGNPTSMAQLWTDRSLGSPPGLDAVGDLVLAGLSYADQQGTLHAGLADAVPSLENGQWQLFPDGRMETTWKIKPNAQWHDGTLLTSADLVFSTVVEQDKELPVAQNPAYALIESVKAPDPSTVIVQWKQPYIEADSMFSYELASPLPQHLLEGTYTADKANLFNMPYWAEEFVGTGPFRIREWVPDSHLVLEAFDGYAGGRPKIDQIEVKFIVDGSAMGAALLAGAADLLLGRTLTPVDQAQQILDQRPDLRAERAFNSWYVVNIQFIGTDPPVIGDVRFRRAMLTAIDRQQLVDSLALGQSAIAHSMLPPDSEAYKAVESSLVRYDYDPRRAAQMVEELGYSKGTDGFFYDAAGQKLSVQVYTTTRSEIQPRIVLAVADFWKQLGVDVDPVMIPPQRINDREYRAQFPAFEILSGANSIRSEDIRRMSSSSIPLPENHFTATGNNSRWSNPENDALVQRYMTTIPYAERMQVLADLLHLRTDQLPVMGLFFEAEFTIHNAKLERVTSRGPRSSQAWNAQLWDLQS